MFPFQILTPQKEAEDWNSIHFKVTPQPKTSREGSSTVNDALSYFSSRGLIKMGANSQRQDLDVVRLDGGVFETWTTPMDTVEPVLHVILKFLVSFTLTSPLHVEKVEAQFLGNMDFIYGFRAHFLTLSWALCSPGVFEPNQKYEFEVMAELPPDTPCSLETEHARICYEFQIKFMGEKTGCELRGCSQSLNVWNPYLVFDAPRSGLGLGVDEVNMVGATIELGKGITAFVRYPDQWINVHAFPLEISFPGTAEEALPHLVTSISVTVFQYFVFQISSTTTQSRTKDTAQIAHIANIVPTMSLEKTLIPLSPKTLGRFTSDRFRIVHALRVVFHRPLGYGKHTWDQSIEIFHPYCESYNAGLSQVEPKGRWPKAMSPT